MTEIKIGGRTIPLNYTTYEMIAIQKELGCTAFQLNEQVFDVKLKDEDDPTSMSFGIVKDGEKIEKLGKLIRMLGNAGLEEKGEKPDLEDKWILRQMKPAYILAYSVAVMKELNDGNHIEAVKQEQEGAVDEVLEEQNAKKQPGN